MYFKWDSVKEKAILAAVGNVDYTLQVLAPWAILAGINSGDYGWKKNAIELRAHVIRIIAAWDIRRCMALIELFPCVPECYRKRVPTIRMLEDPDASWVLEY